ncbi:Lipoprotein-releasing system ATP-binding protein LolD [hydrothermal vent metagenome]|uniref:Lipoprotein-releasing system ATP-binding protein LolD n=1 Tax=hydrothermal vent metagenome TaxID=652676 RepID=A0A3B0V6E7_9ZZZZ
MNKTENKIDTPQAPLFEARGITMTFAGPPPLTVLNKLDISIAEEEMIAIVGASGTGKTTLLNILGTLERPTAGSWLYQGRDVFTRQDRELDHFRNRAIGFVFQSHHLLPEFSAVENIMMPGLIAGMDKAALRHEADILLNKTNLTKQADSKIGELSGGEQQRVALARALIMKPALLLADEPTGNLDPDTGLKVFELLKEMNNTFKLATIMVTHNYHLASRMDRCLTLANGRLHLGGVSAP